MDLLSNLEKKEPEMVYDAGNLQVLDINGYTAIKEPDMVICIPYLVEKNTIILRYENIPPYNLIKPTIEKFVTSMSTVIEKHETPEEAMKRGLANDFGLKIKETCNIEILAPIFLNKGNTASYHICILPLMSHDYEEFTPTGIQELNMKDNNIMLHIKEMNNVIIYDLITRYSINLFKQYYSLF